MKILITPDVWGSKKWAIGNITEAIIKYNPRFNFEIIAVHPREVVGCMIKVRDYLKDHKIDLWHAQYWRSATQLLELIPELKDVKKILSHYNHESLEKDDWSNFDVLSHATQWGCEVLRKKHNNVFNIPYGVDLNKFSYIIEREKHGKTVGYIGRVLDHKHLKDICDVSKKLGYKVLGSGYIEKPRYWQIIDRENLEFKGGIGRNTMTSENVKNELYRRMTCFVMYSTGEKESGTLPLLEAMARGVPVLATEQGMARDLIKDGHNGLLFHEKTFEAKLKRIMEDENLRIKLRENAWQTIKGYSLQKMAREYGKMYYKAMFPKQKLISVIIPTFNRGKNLLETILSIERNNYKAKEIIICDDGSDDETENIVRECKKQCQTNILYLKTGEKLEYGLAKARNLGTIEALGDILLFLDDRFILLKDTLEKIVLYNHPNCWYHGDKIIKGKPANRKDFIENFSWIDRQSFMNCGMFNERITQYGGMSQDIRTRCKNLDYNFVFCPEVFTEQNMRSSGWKTKHEQVWKSKFLLHKIYE